MNSMIVQMNFDNSKFKNPKGRKKGKTQGGYLKMKPGMGR
jgi:hypothetical protein